MFEILFGLAVLLCLLLLAIGVAVGVVVVVGKWLWGVLLAWIVWVMWRFGRARAWW